MSVAQEQDSAEQSPLAFALTKEHHEIDAGIEAFIKQLDTADNVVPEGQLRQWAQPLLAAMAALRRHIYLEEMIVFPRMRRGPLMMPVMVMFNEHGEIWRKMDELEAALNASEPLELSQRTAVVESCHAMLALLENHNMKEEPIIYPHIDADLDHVAKAQLKEFIEEGEMPEGWVCEKL